ncbi:hypothetical protein R80B4_00445 [Fibrobacteres bacterium R8-0-B4]
MKKTGLYKLACASALTLGLCGCADVPDYMEECGGGRQWLNDQSPTVNLNTNGGTVSPASAKTSACGTLKTLPTPSKARCIFDGWFTQPAGGDTVSSNYVFYGNATIYAQWIDTAGSYDDGQYEEVQIDNQIWMKKNLNIATRNSSCYDSSAEYCRKYGRLYTWAEARKACPTGWRLPTRDDWQKLARVAGGTGPNTDAGDAGKKLKSDSGWVNNGNIGQVANGNGIDSYNFTALPGGYHYYKPGETTLGPHFGSYGEMGYWWTDTPVDNENAYSRVMYYTDNFVHEDKGVKTYSFSVRCLKNENNQ